MFLDFQVSLSCKAKMSTAFQCCSGEGNSPQCASEWNDNEIR
jgi:hypothetical protein